MLDVTGLSIRRAGSFAPFIPTRSTARPAGKSGERFPGSELHLLGVEAADRSEVLRILRNEERRAREKNPLERGMHLNTRNGSLRVETTTEKLAQRLGRAVKEARDGKIAYKWGHNNKFVRVVWEKRTD